MTDTPPNLRPWRDVPSDEQTRLRIDYQVELDTHPLTCSLDEKMNRFTAWLEQRGISFTMDDLRRKK